MSFFFYVSLFLFAVGALIALMHVRHGIGLPVLAVLSTVFFWYMGDVAYNNYDFYQRIFKAPVLDNAWMQVALFLLSFLAFVSIGIGNRRPNSHLYNLYRYGHYRRSDYQQAVRLFFQICIIIWFACVFFAFVVNPSRLPGFLLSFLGDRYNPFARGQIGGGLSAIISLMQYLYLLVGAGFGVVVALSRNRRTRIIALMFCVSIWSFFLLDRTRNSLIVVILPSVLCWIFIRYRGSLAGRIIILLAGMAVMELWFSFIMAVRAERGTVSQVFYEEGVGGVLANRAKHGGLNMFEELCWITLFLSDGKLVANGGERYFAELVNLIPRGLWPEKPTIGLDYAVARGQRMLADGSVTATISTGLIGQGTTNFGIYMGPVAAAFLMNIWVRVLASIDTAKTRVKLPLVFIGLVLTFNLGRDITLLVLYPFVFGYLAFAWFESRNKQKSRRFRRLVDA